MPVDREFCVHRCGKDTLRNPTSKFHPAPKNADLSKKWKETLRLSDPLPKLPHVCDSHFQVEAMGRTQLKKKAIPTVDLASDECLDENVELVCDHVAARQYQTNNSKLRKKIEDLEKEIKDLNERNTFLQTKNNDRT
ncbi:unnamed protein product [Ceratitis capitata]|uniref:(Mediterranean fruit fly) hypothetical protein n=1 Tax=Ceratitis capitata TaxID=7213 RepID=A0A811UXB7_CERCA|nr:unnamed protein product [Ceratitis capitata]